MRTKEICILIWLSDIVINLEWYGEILVVTNGAFLRNGAVLDMLNLFSPCFLILLFEIECSILLAKI